MLGDGDRVLLLDWDAARGAFHDGFWWGNDGLACTKVGRGESSRNWGLKKFGDALGRLQSGRD